MVLEMRREPLSRFAVLHISPHNRGPLREEGCGTRVGDRGLVMCVDPPP